MSERDWTVHTKVFTGHVFVYQILYISNTMVSNKVPQLL